MRQSLVLPALLSIICAVGFAYVASAFVTEKPFPHATAQKARAQVMKKFDRNIYGSENVVIDEVFYVTLQFPVHDGGVQRIETRVTDAFYEAISIDDIFVLSYNPDDADQVDFDGKHEPMSRTVWMLILTICALPIFVLVSVFLPGKRKQHAVF